MNWFMQRLKTCFKGLRTVIINALLTIIAILQMAEVIDVLPHGWELPYILFMAVINLYLRTITTTPVGKE